MRRLIWACALVLSAPGLAGAVTLDFDTGASGPLAAGNLRGDEFAHLGVTLSTSNRNGNPLALFNSNCGDGYDVACSGNDRDLATGAPYGTEAQGNVLIINSGTSDNPNDDRRGGDFIFSFGSLTSLNYIDLLDLDERVTPVFTVTYADTSMEAIAADTVTLLGTRRGDNSLRRYSFSNPRITGLAVRLPNVSGAIAAVDYTPAIPLPPGLALALGGLGALALAARRKAR